MKSRTMIVKTGTASFQITMPVLLSERTFAPIRLMPQKAAMSTAATINPTKLNVPSAWSMFNAQYFDVKAFV